VTEDSGPLGASPPQYPYRDAEALFRAAYDDMARTAYALLGNHADTEDATQNSFHKLMMAWPRVGNLPTAAKQRAYLIRIVINEALQILRYPHRRWERPDANSMERGSIQESLEDSVQAREFLRLVWKAISELPEARREVVALRAAGYEYEEIAAGLSISISTVRSHISYARKQLARTVPRGWEGEQE
jgi:RNA polymerase sigma factor (sigma-70 family)